ncbi:PilZ domain-containing protein [Alkalilimnicola sp. S0819]|uniref:PilZ domain-containing protein n=1 Tax=Alkalilimnicola sp. S0819 TaxID=2613922 RepID=UPI0012620204|nr:PilZ domain-containing protein [Alkalilimnicola sp. S0819]KAB7628447.1 PilZ domain-containing protein [Alkalilimnicola sp. S0819]MPQ15351.1 hypothetical protein [Alkalilimnicola sp. S0819]
MSDYESVPAGSAEQRAQPRYRLGYTLPVRDLRGRALGQLSNLSAEGFMLVSDEPLEANRRYDLVLQAEGGEVRLSARCVWCQPSSYSTNHGAGFRIEVVLVDDRPRFQALLRTAGPELA